MEFLFYFFGEGEGGASAPVGPEPFLGVSVGDVRDLADAGDDVRLAADELADFAYLVGFRQREDVLDSGRRSDLLVEPDQQRLERQERLVAHRRLQTLYT